MRNQSLYRQWHILHRINQAGARGVSKGDLAKEFNVSKKTIARDITNLSTCGFPIYDQQKPEEDSQVFYYFTPGYKIPSVAFSFEDLFILKLIEAFHRGMNGVFQAQFSTLLKKISTSLDATSHTFFRHLQEALLSDSDAMMGKPDSITAALEALVKALLNLKKVQFLYYSVQSDRHSMRIVTPLAIRLFNHNFYLAAHVADLDRVLTFALNRISEIDILDDSADDIDFDSQT